MYGGVWGLEEVKEILVLLLKGESYILQSIKWKRVIAILKKIQLILQKRSKVMTMTKRRSILRECMTPQRNLTLTKERGRERVTKIKNQEGKFEIERTLRIEEMTETEEIQEKVMNF